MKTYLMNLNEREQWMIFGAAVVVFIYIYYMFLYSPLITKVEQRTKQFKEKKATLVCMEHIKQQKPNNSNKQLVDNGKLLTLLATQLKNSTLLRFPYQLQQTSAGEIQLSFEQVPFKFFIQWLLQVDMKYSINMKQLEMNKTATPGMAQIMIVLSSSVDK